MIEAKDFISALLSRGYDFFTGVPCSLLKPLIDYVEAESGLEYISAASEGQAVGIAAGAYLGGRKTVLMLQNSGLGNMVNPLASLNFPFKIPALIIVTLRGEPGLKDEPQHQLMGRITGDLLDTLSISRADFPKSSKEIEMALDRAQSAMASASFPYAFIMKKGSIAETAESFTAERGFLQKAPARNIRGKFKQKPQERMSRKYAIKSIKEIVSDEYAIVASTGKIGRELYDYADSDNHLYMVGSMGCAAAIGLGIQRAKPRQKTLVLDGDGAILMKMGILATIGHYQPKGLVHVILDNESYESTGGQSTVSPSVDFSAVAAACGYNICRRVDSLKELKSAFLSVKKTGGPALIHIKIASGSESESSRPAIAPYEVKERFMKFLNR